MGIGANPADMIEMLATNGLGDASMRVLDLGCGKGAVAIRLAHTFGCQVKGIDLMPDFIATAKEKAREWQVDITFTVADMQTAVGTESDYDLVIFGAVGNVLGGPDETLNRLAKTLRPGGHLLLDDAYLRKGEEAAVRYDHPYPTLAQWEEAFHGAGFLQLAAKESNAEDLAAENNRNMACITARAAELKQRHPSLKALFDRYIESQAEECEDLADYIVGVTWLLQWKPAP